MIEWFDAPDLYEEFVTVRAERDRLREALRSIQAVAVMTQNDHASQHRLDWLREIEQRAREALGPEVERAS